MIRSAYSSVEISEARLRLSRAITIPSLMAQTRKDFEVVLRINPKDPLLSERVAAFESIGVPVHVVGGDPIDPTFQDQSNLAGFWRQAIEPGEWTLQTRMDDDDALAGDFVSRLRQASKTRAMHLDTVFTFPIGYVWANGQASLRNYRGNQFISLATRSRIVYDASHNVMTNTNRVKEVDQDPAWLWVRHPDAVTIKAGREYTHLTKDIPASRLRFAIDWAALDALALQS